MVSIVKLVTRTSNDKPIYAIEFPELIEIEYAGVKVKVREFIFPSNEERTLMMKNQFPNLKLFSTQSTATEFGRTPIYVDREVYVDLDAVKAFEITCNQYIVAVDGVDYSYAVNLRYIVADDYKLPVIATLFQGRDLYEIYKLDDSFKEFNQYDAALVFNDLDKMNEFIASDLINITRTGTMKVVLRSDTTTLSTLPLYKHDTPAGKEIYPNLIEFLKYIDSRDDLKNVTVEFLSESIFTSAADNFADVLSILGIYIDISTYDIFEGKLRLVDGVNLRTKSAPLTVRRLGKYLINHYSK